MAKEKLASLLRELKIEDEFALSLEVRHFFSGAALYANEQVGMAMSDLKNDGQLAIL